VKRYLLSLLLLLTTRGDASKGHGEEGRREVDLGQCWQRSSAHVVEAEAAQVGRGGVQEGGC